MPSSRKKGQASRAMYRRMNSTARADTEVTRKREDVPTSEPIRFMRVAFLLSRRPRWSTSP
jgi:hypothetical protein